MEIFEYFLTLTFSVIFFVLLYVLEVAIIYCIAKALHFLIHEFSSIVREVKEKYLRTTYMTRTENTTRNYGNTKGYTVVWKIENLDYCCLRKGQHITMPVFTTDELYGTKWSLRLFPKGVGNDYSAAVVLKREYDHYGPNVIQVIYQIVFLDKDGSILEDKYVWKEGDFERMDSVYFLICERRENVLSSERKAFLPEDNVTVQCRIWMKDEKPVTFDFLSAVTKVHRRSFVWKIGKFSTFPPAQRSEYESIDELGVTICFFLNVASEKLHIDIRSFGGNIPFYSFVVSIVDSEGRKVKGGQPRYIHGNCRKRTSFKLFFPRRLLIEKRSLYLPNDVLSLECHYVFLTANTSYGRKCVICSPVI